jgi:hypothetical protein
MVCLSVVALHFREARCFCHRDFSLSAAPTGGATAGAHVSPCSASARAALPANSDSAVKVAMLTCCI